MSVYFITYRLELLIPPDDTLAKASRYSVCDKTVRPNQHILTLFFFSPCETYWNIMGNLDV